MKSIYLLLVLIAFVACKENPSKQISIQEMPRTIPAISSPSLIVLGTAQDAGSPHIACTKKCCEELFVHPDENRKVVSLGIVDPIDNKTFLFEATPDMTSQVKALQQFSNSETELPDGIFLTHGHIGHYTGLMYLGKEATNASNIPVYAMPRMKSFLETSGPWSQLVSTGNISINEIAHQKSISLTTTISVTPFAVPHRDEYSETVGYLIEGPSKKVLFIPDIDKWEKWETSIIEAISDVDYAFVDATFYSGEEINTRDISEIPHPFIIESMELFKALPLSEKQKIHFIHFNHTNPAFDKKSEAYKTIIDNGFNIAKFHEVIAL